MSIQVLVLNDPPARALAYAFCERLPCSYDIPGLYGRVGFRLSIEVTVQYKSVLPLCDPWCVHLLFHCVLYHHESNERDASVCLRRHQAFALAPETEFALLLLTLPHYLAQVLADGVVVVHPVHRHLRADHHDHRGVRPLPAGGPVRRLPQHLGHGCRRGPLRRPDVC